MSYEAWGDDDDGLNGVREAYRETLLEDGWLSDDDAAELVTVLRKVLDTNEAMSRAHLALKDALLFNARGPELRAYQQATVDVCMAESMLVRCLPNTPRRHPYEAPRRRTRARPPRDRPRSPRGQHTVGVPVSDRINNSVPIVQAGVMNLEYGVQTKLFMMNGCRILVSHDPTHEGLMWHLSISRRDRDPSWNEIATARYRLLANVEEMAMYLPRLDDYVNLHPFTFHLHEVKTSRILLP